MLELPWPPSVLSPNDRSHWAVKAKAKASYRADCGWIAKTYKPEIPDGSIPLVITFHPPTKRHFDRDNLLARIKSGLDGVADTWGINDKRFGPVTIDIGSVVKNGCVRLEIPRK